MSSTTALHAMVGAMEEAQLHSKEIHVAYIDCKKAFDSLHHDTIFCVLWHYGLGDKFVGVIERLYNNCYATVKVNGTPSSPFAISRGVWQGDTLSPLLFILTINPFLDQVVQQSCSYIFNNGL